MHNHKYKRLKKWSHALIVGLVLMPFLMVAVSSITTLVAPQNVVVHADDGKKNESSNDSSDGNKKKDSSSSSSSSSSSDSSSGTDKSAWNSALSTLSESAVGAGKNGTNSATNTISNGVDNTLNNGDQQADINKITTNYNFLAAWGFMGNGNSDVWEKNNASSWTSSYSSLISGGTGSDNLDNSYKQSARFAYALQATGLDQPSKSGFSTVPWYVRLLGFVMSMAYYVLNFAQEMFKIMLTILQNINPIQWALYGSSTVGKNTMFAPLADFMQTAYNAIYKFGWAVAGLLLAAGLGFAATGITFSSSGGFKGQGRSITAVFVAYLERLFVVVVIPVVGLSLFNVIVTAAKDSYTTNANSVPNYAVYGAFVDYNDWAMNSRLDLPSDVDLPTTFDASRLPSLTHQKILSINYNGAGIKELNGLYNKLSGAKDASGIALGSDFTSSSQNNSTKLNNFGIQLLNAWSNGASITAADYASSQDAAIRQAAKNSSQQSGSNSDSNSSGSTDLSAELVKAKYNDNGNIKTYNSGSVGGYTSNSYFESKANNGQPYLLTNYNVTPNGTRNGGLSTLGMYAYMLTTAGTDNMTISDTEQLQNDVAQAQHRSSVLVGTGIQQAGNLVWAFGMMVGLAIVIVGYLWETAVALAKSLPSLAAATLQSGLWSIRAGIQVISVILGVGITVFVGAVMYSFSQIAFIAVSQYADGIFSSHGLQTTINFVSLHNGSSVGTLTTSATQATIQGAANFVYGIFLIWLAIMLFRYRALVITSITSIVEDTANKILATFGNVTGTGSSGTQKAIMQNTNVSNGQNSTGLGSMLQSGGKYAMLAGGAAGGASLLGGNKNGGVLGSNESGKKGDSDQTKMPSYNSSSEKQGNASERTREASEKEQKQDNNAASQEVANGNNDNGLNSIQGANPQSMSNKLDDGNSRMNQPLTGQDGLAMQPMRNNGSDSGVMSSMSYQPNNSNADSSYADQGSIGQNNSLSDTGSNANSYGNDDNLQQAQRLGSPNSSANANGNNLRDYANQTGNNLSNGQGQTTSNESTNQSNSTNTDEQSGSRRGDFDNMVDQPNGLTNGQEDSSNGISTDGRDGVQGDNSVQTNSSTDDQNNTQTGQNTGNQISGDNTIGQGQNLGNVLSTDDSTSQMQKDNAFTPSGNTLENGDSQTTENSQNGLDQVGNNRAANDLGTGQTLQNGSRLTNGMNGLGTTQSLGNSQSLGTNGNSNVIGQGNANGNTLGASNRREQGRNGAALGANNGLDNPTAAGAGSIKHNGLTNAANLNADMTPNAIQSQMGGIQNAKTQANTANSLADANPDNQTLRQRANNAANTLGGLQDNALNDYNAQPVGANNVQSAWLNDGANASGISTGAANNAMDGVYSAQQNVATAQSKFGEGSPQLQTAQANLSNARNQATQAGLSPDVVNDEDQVASAHNAIAETKSNLMDGTWKPSAAASNLGDDGGRSIGI